MGGSTSIGELKAKVSSDVSGFSTGMEQVKRATQENLNQFKVAASAARAFGSATDELKAKQQYLAAQLDQQRKKVELLQAAYDKSAAEKGKDAKATQGLADKLATAKAALNNTEGDLKKVNTALSQQEEKGKNTASMWDRLKSSAGKAGQVLAGIGKVAMAGVGAAGAGLAAMGAGIGKMAYDAAATGEALSDMSAKTGISTERLQELKYAGDILGTDLETLTGSLSKMTRSMADAKGGGAAAEAFDTLGVAVTGADGSLRDSEAVLSDALAALGGVANETERDALAMQIFGKSAMELNPLIKAGGDELARLSEEAHKVGAVMSDEDVAAASAFKDQLDSLKMGMQGTLATVGSAFMPALSKIATKGGEYLSQFAAIVKKSNGDVSAMGAGVSALAGQIVGDLAAQLPGVLQAGMSLLQGLAGAIIQNLPVLVTAAVQVVMSLVEFLLANIPMILQAAIDIILALVNGLVTAIPLLIPAMVQAVGAIVEGLVSNLPALIMAAVQLMGALIEGLVGAIPELVNAIPQIITALIQAFAAAGPDLLKVGKNVIDGVWSGILSMKDKFSADVKAFFKGIVDAVKGVLGIKSPSKVMIPIGRYTVSGFVSGVKDASRRMQADVEASMRGLALSGGAAGAGAMNESFVFYGPVMIGGGQGERMSQAVKRKRY